MREVISTDLILRLIHATPEQFARVERALGVSGSDGWTPAATDDDARKLFALLKALETEGNYHKAPVTRVFMLYCHESLTRQQVAKACGCSVSLVKERLKSIERKLGRKVSELRNLALDFSAVAQPVTDSRARRIKPVHSLDDTDPYEDE